MAKALKQADLFGADQRAAMLTLCASGIHGDLIVGPPQVFGDAVNFDSTCVRCGQIVKTESWTKEAYEQRHER